MLTGELLDGGEKGLAQAVGGAAAITVVLLGAAVVVPVILLVGLLHIVPLPSIPVPSVTGVPLVSPALRDAAPVGAGSKVPAPIGVPVVAVAQRYLGVPYVFGGTNP